MAFDALVSVVVWLFLSSAGAKTRHRLPCFSIGARYQPGAAHQKGAIPTTTAPCWNPRGRRNGRERVFDPPLASVLVVSRHRKQYAVTWRHTRRNHL
jgi:hypothetical protein